MKKNRLKANMFIDVGAKSKEDWQKKQGSDPERQ